MKMKLKLGTKLLSGIILTSLTAATLTTTGMSSSDGMNVIEYALTSEWKPPATWTEIGIVNSSGSGMAKEIWHYTSVKQGISGGVWSNAAATIAVGDKALSLGFTALDEAQTAKPVTFDQAIPASTQEELKQAVKDGKKIHVVLQRRDSNPEIGNLFYLDADKEKKGKYAFTGNYSKISFKAYPKLNFLPDPLNARNIKTMKEYKYVNPIFASIAKANYIPIPDPAYGYISYSMFGPSLPSGGFTQGYEDHAEAVAKQGISPDMIKDINGFIKPGNTILSKYNKDYIIITTKTLPNPKTPTNLSIGSGTFSAAGAIGIHFDFNVKIVFYVEQAGKNAEITSEKVKIIKLSTNKEVTSVSPEDNIKFNFQYKFTSAVGTKVPQDIELSVVGYSSPDMTKEVVNKAINLSTDNELGLDKLKNQDITLIIPKASDPTMIGVSKIYWKVYVNGGHRSDLAKFYLPDSILSV